MVSVLPTPPFKLDTAIVNALEPFGLLYLVPALSLKTLMASKVYFLVFRPVSESSLITPGISGLDSSNFLNVGSDTLTIFAASIAPQVRGFFLFSGLTT